MTTINNGADVVHWFCSTSCSNLKDKNYMKNIFKLLHIGITFTIIGAALAASSFISYLMSDHFVSIVLLPAGIILFVTGWLLVKKAKKHGA